MRRSVMTERRRSLPLRRPVAVVSLATFRPMRWSGLGETVCELRPEAALDGRLRGPCSVDLRWKSVAESSVGGGRTGDSGSYGSLDVLNAAEGVELTLTLFSGVGDNGQLRSGDLPVNISGLWGS
jgi:hypothetical protein